MKKNYNVKVSDWSEQNKKENNRLYELQLQKLQWYKLRGRSKESLISDKIFPISFIEKNY
jgi:hypothetical protein